MAKNDREDRKKAMEEHVQKPADETIAAGEHMDLDAMDAAVEAESAAGAPMPTGYTPPASSQNPYLSEEMQGVEIPPKVFGPPQYGSPDPASAASRLMTLEDGHPLAGLEFGTAAISEDYGQEGAAAADAPESGAEIDATDGAKELAEEENIDLNMVTGTGQDGRITKGDVEDFIAANNGN